MTSDGGGPDDSPPATKEQRIAAANARLAAEHAELRTRMANAALTDLADLRMRMLRLEVQLENLTELVRQLLGARERNGP